MNESLPPLDCFLLPQGSRAIAQTHICRTICRRLERKISLFCTENEFYMEILKVVNRLSDYFFILARYLHNQQSVDEKCFK
jgi:cob(I)alamin adenosyltransferase